MTLFGPTFPRRERRTIAPGAIHLPGWLDTHAATSAGPGLPGLVDRAGPDQGGVPATWAPHVGPDRLPGLALGALSLRPHR
jgi:hypothetical protein